MKVIVFEGNTTKTNQNIIRHRGLPYHQLFGNVVREFDASIQVNFAFVADKNYTEISADDLRQYDAALWTGSSLNPYDETPEVQQQISQSKQVFKSGIPYYGSCWGLQIAVVASGGKTAPCKQGLEVGIAQNITLTPAGAKHPLLSNRPSETGTTFCAFCLHYAEVTELPENATVLAYNNHSKIQAVQIEYAGGTFFGVQYHPEFNINTLKAVYRRNHQKFLNMGLYASTNDADTQVDLLIQEYIADTFAPQNHTKEIYNFLTYAKKKKTT